MKPVAEQEIWSSNPNEIYPLRALPEPKPGCIRKVEIGTVVVFLILMVTIVIHAVLVAVGQNKNRSCDDIPLPCPPDWIWYQRKCYYFSKEESSWNISQYFCSLHDASLATLTNEEKNFIRLLKGREAFWIGLRRSQGQSWKWLNGENATLEILGDGGDCVYLNNEFKAISSRCRTTLLWLCSKPDSPKKPKKNEKNV